MTTTLVENATQGLIEGFFEDGVHYQLNPAIDIAYKSSLLYNLESMTYSCESPAGIKANGTLTRVSKTEDKTLKDSGERRSFDTGAVRDLVDGKGRFDLLPAYAIKRMAKHFEKGSKKYGDRNWEKGMPLSVFLDSALRHQFAHLDGQRDEDHLAAAAWNLLCMIETEERIRRGVLPATLGSGIQEPTNLHKNPEQPI